MNNQLYVKTDGPVPEGVGLAAGKVYIKANAAPNVGYLTLGKVYEAEQQQSGSFRVIGDDGHAAYVGRGLLDSVRWTFCDSEGNPVPAPWEKAEQPYWLCCGSKDPAHRDERASSCSEARQGHRDRVKWGTKSEHSSKTAVDYRAHAERMAEALAKIQRWQGEFPETGKTWPDSDRPMSYAACYGSNGERDYMRGVAAAALAAYFSDTRKNFAPGEDKAKGDV